MTGAHHMTMNIGIRSLVEAIHSTPTQSVLYLAVGASQVSLSPENFFSDEKLVGTNQSPATSGRRVASSVTGASSKVLETLVPYSRMSMIQFLGKIPVKFFSQSTAEEMALLAYNRVLKLSSPGHFDVGFICRRGHRTGFRYQQ